MPKTTITLPDVQTVIDAVTEGGFYVTGQRKMNNGDQITLDNGAIVNFYDSGKVYVSGTNVDEIWPILERKANEVYQTSGIGGQASDVAVVCLPGFDDSATAVDLLRLGGLKLSPLALNQPSPDALLTRLDKVATGARFAVIAADQHALTGDQALLQEQIPFAAAVGLALGRFKQPGVVVLLKGKEATPDWLSGITCLRYQNDLVAEVGLKLGAALKGQGLDVKPEPFVKTLAPALPAKGAWSVGATLKDDDEKQALTPKIAKTKGRPKGSTNKKKAAGQEKAGTGQAATQ